MRRCWLLVSSLLFPVLFPVALAGQSSATASRLGVIAQFERIADIFGGQLVAAFDSIPASRYEYRPTPLQQTVGYIAQHVENANYSLCERLGSARHARTSKDSLRDSVKAHWPKDTLVRRLDASLRFCDTAIEQLTDVDSPALASNLLLFETDLAEHYSQIAGYMRLLGLVPPSALPPRPRVAIELPASALAQFVGTYDMGLATSLIVSTQDGALMARGSAGGESVRLWPESATEFFVKEVDAQITFVRDAGGKVTGLILHQYGRDKKATRVR